ncbi:MAG: protein kinase [Planctomycetota bacterium]
MSLTAQDEAFLSLATGRGLLRREDAARLRRDLGEQPAAQAAVRERLLSPQASSELVRELIRARFRCQRCGAEQGYEALSRLTRLDCPSCGAAGGLAPPGADDGLVQPSLPSQRFEPSARPGVSAGSGIGLVPQDPLGSGLGPPPSGAAPSSGPSSGIGPAVAARPRSSGAHDRPGFGLPPSVKELEPSRQKRRRLGGYELLEELGRGNNGVVYLARRPGLDRRFALKVLLGTAALDAESRARFELEAQIASKLDHPGIIAVYDIGRDGEHYYYAMEHCAGPTLADRIKEGPLPPREAARVLAELSEALTVAHERQVVHRDLKPANVILDQRDGRPRITDFGLARDRELAESMTKTGDILGTPYYMSPEQLRGERPVDARADIYALGVILYECLAGIRPYKASSPFELARLVFQGSARPLRELEPRVPAELEAIQRRAMAVDKETRYASARELAAALRAWLGRDEDVAETRPQRRRRGRRRPWALAAAGAALLVAAGAGAVIARLAGARQRRQALEALLSDAYREAPGDPAALDAELARAEGLAPGDPEVARLRAWAGAWRAVTAARAALERSPADAEAARRALAEARGVEGPHLGAAVDELAARLAAEEELSDLTERSHAMVPLDDRLVARFEALISRCAQPLRRRARLELLDYLARRLSVDRYARVAPTLEAEPDRRRAQLARVLLLVGDGSDRSQHQDMLRELLASAARDEPVKLCAQALLWLTDRPDPSRTRAIVDALERAQRLEPGLAAAQLGLFCAQQVAEVGEARRGLLEWLTRRPDDALAALWLLRAQTAVRELEPALETASRLRALLGARTPELVFLLAVISSVEARPADASRWLEQGLLAWPDSSALQLFRGVLLDRQGKSREAMEVWRAEHKQRPQAFEHAVRSFMTSGAEPLLRALKSEPGAAQVAQLALGTLTAALEERLAARAARVPEPARAALLRALRAAAQGGEWDAYAPDLEAARQAAPRDATLALERVRLLTGRDRFDASLEAIQAAEALGAPAAALGFLRAQIMARRGQLGVAEALERAAAADPEGVWGVRARAARALYTNQLADAATAVGQALARDPHDARALLLAARLSHVKRDFARASELLARAHDEVGASDTELITVYALIQAGAAFEQMVSTRTVQGGVMGHLMFVTQRLFKLTQAAWPRVALAQQPLELGAGDAFMWQWVATRLGEAEQAEPSRADVHVLFGLLALRLRQPREKVFARWRRAAELEGGAEMLRGYAPLYRKLFGDDPAFEALLPRDGK